MAEASNYIDRVIPSVTHLPESERGLWRIKRKEIKEPSQLERLLALIHGSGRYVPAGTYTGLFRGDTIVMSDTPDEKRDHLEFVRQATGSVLIMGLGIGMVLQAVLLKEDVTDVTVIELDPDVIALVSPHYTDPRITIVCADALEWTPPPGKTYDAAWFDIWDTISEDNLDDMKLLTRRFGRKAKWKGSWGRNIIDAERRRDRRSYW
jgi:spermidine synthase